MQVEQVTVLPPVSLAELGMKPLIDRKLGLANIPFTPARIDGQHGSIFLALGNHYFVGEHLAHLLDLMKPVDRDLGPLALEPEYRYFGSRQAIAEDFRMILEARGAIKPGNPPELTQSLRLDSLHANDPHIGQSFSHFINTHGLPFYRALQDGSLTVTGLLGALKLVDIEKNVAVTESSITDRLAKGSQDHMLQYQINFPPFDSLFDEFLRNRQGLGRLRYILERYRVHEAYYESQPYEIALMQKDFVNGLTADQRFDLVVAYLTKNPVLLVDPVKQQSFSKNEKLVLRESFSFERVDDDLLIIGGPQGSVRIKFRKHESDLFYISSEARNSSYAYIWSVVGYGHSMNQNPDSLVPLIAWRNIDGIRESLIQQEAENYFKYLPIPKVGRADVKMGELFANYCSDIPTNFRRYNTGRLKGSTFQQQILGAQVPVWVESPKQRDQLYGSNTSVPAILEQYAG